MGHRFTLLPPTPPSWPRLLWFNLCLHSEFWANVLILLGIATWLIFGVR